MLVLEEKYIRYSIIDRCVKKKMTKRQIHAELNKHVKTAYGTIKHDMAMMREKFDAPIELCGPMGTGLQFYQYSKPYDFARAFMLFWSDWIEYPKHINKWIFGPAVYKPQA